jgi:vitamin B12 transporter
MRNLSLRQKPLACACLLLFSVFTHAQSSWVQGQETVVVGQLLREPLTEVIPSMSVLTQQDIQSAPARDVFELINGLPGVEATRAGPIGSPITVSMRGASSAQTLVLIDGMPVNSQSAIGAISPLEAMPLALIRRIEILRGNATAQYGPGAVGGVINITTVGDLSGLIDGEVKTHASATLGRFGEKQWVAGLSTKTGDNAVSLTVGNNQNRGFNAIQPVPTYGSNPGPNGYANGYYSLMWSREISAQTELGFRMSHSKLRSEFDNLYGFETDLWENKSTVDLMSAFVKHKFTPDWLTKLQYSDSQNKQSTYTNGQFNESYGSFDTRFKNVNWDNTYALSDRHVMTFGALNSNIELNAHHQGYLSDGTAVPVILQPNLSTARLYTGVSSAWGRLNTQLTLSHDQLGQGVSARNFLLGAGYSLGLGYKITATRSSALLSPTVGQRYDYPYGGNPSLRPERSYSNEAGLQYTGDRLSWRLVAFDVNYQNLISPGNQLVSDPFWRAQNINQLENIGQSSNKGYEWSSNLRQGPWSLGLNLTWQNPQNIDSDLKPINKARRYGSLRSIYDFSAQTRLSWITYMTSDRNTLAPTDYSASSPTRTSGYAVHNLALEQKLDRNWSGKLSLINVADKKYNSIAGYAPQPRTWLVTVTYLSN